jgi:lysophospholipase L1-like esterase
MHSVFGPAGRPARRGEHRRGVPGGRRRPALATAALALAALLAAGCSSGGGHDDAASTRHAGAGASASAGVSGSGGSGSGHVRPNGGTSGSLGPIRGPRPASMVALGDSITRGFDTCGLLTDCPTYSWATGRGSGVTGLASRLIDRPTGHTWNLAVSGARMAALPNQVTAATAHHPDLVTVLMGANDACRSTAGAMTPVPAFRSQFSAALAQLHRELPRARVVVASIPDIYQVWKVGHTQSAARGVWELGMCPSMLADPTSTAPSDVHRRAAVRARVVAYNTVLGQVCGQYATCSYDGGAVFRTHFTASELSHVDWFHPSAAGQARLAGVVYRAVFAKKS